MSDAKLSTPNFGTAVKKFADAGISQQFLIPVAPPGAKIGHTAVLTENVLGKAPGRYDPHTDTWAGLSGDILTRGVSRAEAAKFLDWPTGNVGILGAAYPAIDSDAQSPEAADAVHAAVQATFAGFRPAVRVRGKNDRLLYAFRARDWKNDPVRTRHISYVIDGVESGLDIIGRGNQYLIDGTHPGGDAYGWQEGDELYNRGVLNEIEGFAVDDADIDRFVDAFEHEIARIGGKVINKRGTYVNGSEYDPELSDPSLSSDDIFAGLARLPNTADNFRSRDDFIGVVSAVRAAAGRDGATADFEDRVREWAVGSSDGFCDDGYFDKVWRSLRTVRVSGDSLERLFRRNGQAARVAAKDFDDRGPELSANAVKEAKAKDTDDDRDLLDKIAARFIFGDVNLREEKAAPDVRAMFDPEVAVDAFKWYKGFSVYRSKNYTPDLRRTYGDKEKDFWEFLNDLDAAHPECFFREETRNPNFDYGEIIVEDNPDTGRKIRKLNISSPSAVIRAANQPDKDPARSARDVKTFLEFGQRLFGKMWAYELATIAFMAQTGKRPGHMLVMVGDSGVGKSIYAQILTKIFNGSDTAGGTVDGAKLFNEGAARFAFAGVEGCRIISVRELPKGNRRGTATMQQVTSTLKQMVDAGPEGDWFTIEDKGAKAKRVQNFARIIASSNHADSIEIEEGDRRIFMVAVEITHANKPDEDYYGELADLIKDPTRLAAVYRYLRTHSIKGYSANVPPPVSTAKAEQQVMRITNSAERHMRAAIAWMEVNQVVAFDIRDLAETMTDCSGFEADNLGNGDTRVVYEDLLFSDNPTERLQFGKATGKVQKFAYKLEPSRSQAKRDITQFVTLANKEVGEKLEIMARGERLEKFEDLRNDTFRLREPHPWAQFRKGGV